MNRSTSQLVASSLLLALAACGGGGSDSSDRVAWDAAAKLIWTTDLKADNTLLCKLTATAP